MAWIDNEGRIHRTGSPPATQTMTRPRVDSVRWASPPRRKVYCSDRSYMIAGVLAVELGFLGVHNFYAKYYKKGAVQLSISAIALSIMDSVFVVAAIMLIGMFIWGVVEGVLIFWGITNKDGKNQDFWRGWFAYLTSAEYIRPYSYPHTKAWIITAVASLIVLTSAVIPAVGYLIDVF